MDILRENRVARRRQPNVRRLAAPVVVAMGLLTIWGLAICRAASPHVVGAGAKRSASHPFASVDPDTNARRIPLAGQHRYSRGDDSAWAAADFDDSSWAVIAVPGRWPDADFWGFERGWYRLRFRVPDGWRPARPAVAVGHILLADETFLNGVRIGGSGRLGADFVEAPWQERLYRIPPGVLRYDQDNVLAVRGVFAAGGGIVSGPLAVADWTPLEIERLQRERGDTIIQTVFLSFYALAMMFCLLLYSQHVREPEYLRFGILVVCYGLACLFESYARPALGLSTPWLMKAYVALSLALPLAVLGFFASVTGRRCPRLVMILLAVPLAVGCGNLLFSDFWILGRLILPLWFLLALATSGLVAVWVIGAVRQRVPDAGLLLTAVTCGIVGEAVAQLRPFELVRLGGMYPHHYGVALFLGCGMLLLVRRFQRTQQRLRAVSASVLQAHAEERSRVARDLHDGVLQSILAVNLNLKMLHAADADPQRRETLGELVAETSAAVDELRRVAMSLRPATLEKLGLVQALHWYADVAQTHGELVIEIRSQLEREPAGVTAEQLFRIFQEALSNVQKHAAARRVTVTLMGSGDWLTIRIEDDGCGFDAACPQPDGQGLGLLTIRERVELLGGSVTITSAAGRGTTVCATVPWGS
jgi:signal transduction histidine kinase